MRQEQRTGTQSLIRACYFPSLLIRFLKLEMVWIYLSIYFHLSLRAKLKQKQMNRFPKNRFIHHRKNTLNSALPECNTLDRPPVFPTLLTTEHKQAWLCSQGCVKGINFTLFFSALQQKHKRFHKVVYRGTLTSKRLHSRVEEAIHLVQYQPTSECEITYHARAVVGHILYYLMEYSLLSCRSAET